MNKAVFIQWLEQQPPPAEAEALGLRFPDQSSVNFSLAGDWSDALLSQAWQRLAEVAWHLQCQRIKPLQLCCVFGRARVYFALRPDGTGFGAVVPSPCGESMPAAVARLFEDFSQIRD